MIRQDISIKIAIERLKKRRTKTKLELLKILVDLGEGWHASSDIEKIAFEQNIRVNHIFDHLIELSRVLTVIENDYRHKRSYKNTSFRIEPSKLEEIKQCLID